MKSLSTLRTALVIVILAGFTLVTLKPAGAVGGHVADEVFGQFGSFTSSTANNGGISADSLSYASAVAVDEVGHRMFVADYYNHRVLVYNLNSNNVPIDTTADFVLGRATFTTNAPGTSSSQMNGPSAVAIDSNKNWLYVAEYVNNRVLVFDVATITSGEAAIHVLGQSTFTGNAGGTTSSTLNYPDAGLALDSERGYLFVGDTMNHRVMVFDVNTITDGEAAIRVLGQATFGTQNFGATATAMDQPKALAYDTDTDRLFVADNRNNRVLVFNTTTLSNGMAASSVLGQSTMTTNAAAAGTSGMNRPYGLAHEGLSDRLFVSDSLNNRVLIFDVATVANGEGAIDVVGQPDLTTTTAATTAVKLSNNAGLTYVNSSSRLYVPDYGANRVLGFLVPGETQDVTITATVNPALTFSVGSRTLACNGATPTAGTSSSPTAVNFGSLDIGVSAIAAQDLTLSTNATGGASILIATNGPLISGGGGSIANVSGTNATPGAFVGPGPGLFGYTTSENAFATGTADRFTNGGTRWAAFTTTGVPVGYISGPANADITCVAYQVQSSALNTAGTYSTTVTHTAVPVF